MESVFTGFQCHIFFRFIHRCTQHLKALDVLVNGTGGEIAAAGQRHMCLAETTQQCTHQIIAGAHLLDQFRIRLGTGHIAAVDFHHIAFRGGNLRTHPVQNIHQNPDIGNIGHILNPALAADQQGSRNDGDRGILGTADDNRTI